jgi:plasmid maintenance system killer protein
VIVSYRDVRTADFAAGKRVKALSGIERPARLKLDRVDAAIALKDLSALPEKSRGPTNVEIVDYH